jgi:hypothetical protein
MRYHLKSLTLSVCLSAVLLVPVRAAADHTELAQQAYSVLKQYCYPCHGIDFKAPGFNVLDRDILLSMHEDNEQPYVVPGNPDKSYLWQRLGVQADMPPSSKKPTDAEKQLVKKWIEAGAAFPGRAARSFKSEQDILTALCDDLRKTDPGDRKFRRYFTLTHLYNNNKHVTADELRLYAAALSKMVNSVSWKREIAVPKPIDAEATIFVVDLRDLGWDEHRLWQEILKVYPYGLKHNQDVNVAMRNLAQEVYQLAGTDLPYLRADWFIATAARPPLYHTLLRLPRHASALERMLLVDVQADFLRNKLARAGFATSGVSGQNRLVERHAAAYGAYWKSYDFRANRERGTLTQFPLGPIFADNPFPRQAFQHDGGEIIFSQPNGLQGYLLTDGKDNRIDEGPVEVVNDSLKTSGTPAIVSGLSCMACHKHGMIRFKDTIRNGLAVAGEAHKKVQDLYPSQGEMDKLLKKDEEQFLRALEEATGAFLKVGDDQQKGIREFPEPVGAIARLYLKDLDPEGVALELGIADPKELQTLIKANARLRQLGLGPLMQAATIKRETWEAATKVQSLFHEVARELELGTPYRVF